MMKLTASLLFVFLLAISCKESSNKPESSESATETTTANEPPVISFTVLNALPHDPNSYTEGFLIHDGKLFESSGAPGEYEKTRSIVGIVDPASGKIAVKAELDRKTYFGEGITILRDKLYQLTWTN